MEKTNDDAKLTKVLAEFCQTEQCPAEVGIHIFCRVASMLGLNDVELVARLDTLRTETQMESVVGVSRARILRTLYEGAILSRLPEARATLQALIDSPQSFKPAVRH